jgi:serine/threonine protein kinase
MEKHRVSSMDSEVDTPLQDPFGVLRRMAHDFSGRVVRERYALKKLLGRGAFATVYLAHDLGMFGRVVAVKVLHPEHSLNANYIERFWQEVKVAARVTAQHSEHLVPIVDTGVDDAAAPQLVYFVMEYVRGRSLRQLLQPHGPMGEQQPLAWRRAVALTQQVCRAVAVLHAHGVIHRDIKPDNCMLESHPDGERIKLLDFGIAKLLVDSLASDRTPLTGSRVVLGTPRYMAPEMYMGLPFDHHIDVYAIGVMLHEFLTGTVPRAPILHPGEPLRRHDQETLRPTALRPDMGIPPALDAVVLRAIAWLPHDRFDSVDALAVALAEASRSTPAPPRRPARTSSTARPTRRRLVQVSRWMPGFIVLGCSLALVVTMTVTLAASHQARSGRGSPPRLAELTEEAPAPAPSPEALPAPTPPPAAQPSDEKAPVTRKARRPRPRPEAPGELLPVEPRSARRPGGDAPEAAPRT